MFDRKAIAIPVELGPEATAEALEATLLELASECWESRIFQFGLGGLLIVARRPRGFGLGSFGLPSPLGEDDDCDGDCDNCDEDCDDDFDDDDSDDDSDDYDDDDDDDYDDDDGDCEDDELGSLGHGAHAFLGTVFGTVGPVSFEEALKCIPDAIHATIGGYPVHFLADACERLQAHYRAHLYAHGDEDSPCEYAQIVAMVLSTIQDGLRKRLN